MSDLSNAMTPERFAQIGRIFEAVVELPAGARTAYLASACQQDIELRIEVERMLHAAEQSNAMLDLPAVELETELSSDPCHWQEGEDGVLQRRTLERGYKLSHFEILQLIGQGGMGRSIVPGI